MTGLRGHDAGIVGHDHRNTQQILASVFVGLCLFAVMSSAIPARKAANAVITDSLGHV